MSRYPIYVSYRLSLKMLWIISVCLLSVEKEIPIEHVGLFSYLSYSWLDGFMWRAWRKGLDPDSIWTCPSVDSGDRNAQRCGVHIYNSD